MDEILGQSGAIDVLQAALQSGRVHHAYIFHGPAGVGKFTTAREAVAAHNGEALTQRKAFDALPADVQNDLIEFLKSLQVLQPGSQSIVIDEHGNPKRWPPSGDASQNVR